MTNSATNGAGPVAPVLLCFDGSQESANAIARAGELLTAHQALVANVWVGVSDLMLHAPLAGPPSGAIAEGASLADEDDRERSEKSAAEGVDLARAAGFDAQPLSLRQHRNVWWTLRDYVREHPVRAIVVGARGRSRVARTLLGGTSSGLVHHAPTPVLVVPVTATGRSEGPIMFCDDGSDNARQGITRGRALLRGPATVVSLWHSWVVNVPYMVVGASSAAGMAGEIDDAAHAEMAEIASAGAEVASAHGPDCDSKCVRYDGATWRGLLDTADTENAKAVVVGTRGMTGIAGALGSQSAAIASHSSRPVLVVPPVPEPPAEV